MPLKVKHPRASGNKYTSIHISYSTTAVSTSGMGPKRRREWKLSFPSQGGYVVNAEAIACIGDKFTRSLAKHTH